MREYTEEETEKLRDELIKQTSEETGEQLLKDWLHEHMLMEKQAEIIRKAHFTTGIWDEEKIKRNIARNKLKNKSANTILQQDSPWTNLAEQLVIVAPIYYDNNKIWWKWTFDNYRWELTDETSVILQFKKGMDMNPDMSVTKKGLLMEAIKQEARWRQPEELSEEWIQFGDKHYNLQTKKTMKADELYFSVNSIPWSPKNTEETPILDKLITEWVGEKYKPTIYELIAYCCVRDYPISLMFALVGHGRNGKSQFLKILEHFLTKENVATTDLRKLTTNRFESFAVYKKLACVMGETNFSVIRDTDILKRLTGGDLIDYEKKQADKFTDYSYCKIIMATNSLPSSEDTSEGYYRRWLIIDFPNQFPEGKPIWKIVPEEEYHALAKKILRILPKLLDKGEFSNQGTVAHRQKRYIEKSNPLSIFIKEKCKENQQGYVLYNKLFTSYINWLTQKKMRKVSYKEFSTGLRDEGLDIEKTSKKIGHEFINGRWIVGIEMKEEKRFVTVMPDMTPPSIHPITRESKLDVGNKRHNRHTKPVLLESEQKLFSKLDVLNAIKNLNSGGLIYISELLHLFPETPVEAWVKEFISDGDVYSPIPGKIGVLE